MTTSTRSEPRHSPPLRRRRLSELLKELRVLDGRTCEAIGAAAGYSEATIFRLEAGTGARPQLDTVTAVINVYGVTGEKREEILDLTRAGAQRGWWGKYKRIPNPYLKLIGLETEAEEIRNWESHVIAGWLQTPEYARAVLKAGAWEMSEYDRAQRIALRVERAERLLYGPEPVHLHVVLDESVLHRMVGGLETMRDQLTHLHKMAQLPNVRIQILPFSSGATPGAEPFTILTFKHRLDSEAVYVETRNAEVWFDEPMQVADYQDTFARSVQTACSQVDSLRLISAHAEMLTNRIGSVSSARTTGLDKEQ